MTALSTTEKKETSGIVVSFKADGKEWSFKKGNTSFVFSIDGVEKGNVKKIESDLIENKLNIHLTKGLNMFSTKLTENVLTGVETLKILAPDLVTEKQQRNLAARMLTVVNGRCNFDYYLPLKARERPENCDEITREKLVRMLKRENEVRLSEEMLNKLEKETSEYEDGPKCIDKVSCNQPHMPWSIAQCQEMVVQEFGYKTTAEISYALQMLRSARALYPNDMEIKNSAFYLKYNRVRRGELRVNDMYKDVPLITCGQEETKLSNLLDSKKATVIISGSVT